MPPLAAACRRRFLWRRSFIAPTSRTADRSYPCPNSRTRHPAEEARLTVPSVLDAVSGISYGAGHGDPELVQRGHRTLARLRAAQHP